jgi:2'-5' RNA ligase
MSKRIFIAIDISEKAKANIAQFTDELKADFPHIRVGWEKAEKLHLTLKFLGDIDEGQLANLREAVKKTAAGFAPLALRIENTGCFPSPKKAKVLWLGIKDEAGSLPELQARLEQEAEAQGFAKENRPFKAHLTIARLREPQKSDALVERFLQKHFEPAGFEVSEIVIYESKLQPAGSVYSVVETINF